MDTIERKRDRECNNTTKSEPNVHTYTTIRIEYDSRFIYYNALKSKQSIDNRTTRKKRIETTSTLHQKGERKKFKEKENKRHSINTQQEQEWRQYIVACHSAVSLEVSQVTLIHGECVFVKNCL